MKLKSYFASSVQEAMERARQELGPDAMLLNSRKNAPEHQHFGAYEVVFGIASEAAPKKTVAPSVVKIAPSDTVAQELAELRKQIETVRLSLAQPRVPVRDAGSRRTVELSTLHSQLVATELSSSFADTLIAGVENRLAKDENSTGRSEGPPSLERIQAELRKEIENRFDVNPQLGTPGAERNVVMLVGPAGAGKTTTLMKLAIRYGLANRVPVRVLSTDTLRVGGSDQLAAYSRIAGISFDSLHSIAALESAIVESRNKRLILIDTPGLGPGDFEGFTELAQFARTHATLDVHLVLPGYARSSVLERTSQRFRIFSPSKLLFTHVDQAETLGPLLEHACNGNLPVSFLTSGQVIPQDLMEASKAHFTNSLLNRSQIAALTTA